MVEFSRICGQSCLSLPKRLKVGKILRVILSTLMAFDLLQYVSQIGQDTFRRNSCDTLPGFCLLVFFGLRIYFLIFFFFF